MNVSLLQDHLNPDDLDIALVSPNDTAAVIQSDACGSDAGLQTLNFDEGAANFLSDIGPCNEALTVRPSNYDVVADPFLFPVPAMPSNSLAAFNGTPSGGNWRLFAMDDTTNNGGRIDNWIITIDYTPPVPQLTPETPKARVCPKGKRLKKGKCVKKKRKKKKRKN